MGAGANPNITGSHSRKPLQHATLIKHIVLMRNFLEAGANVNFLAWSGSGTDTGAKLNKTLFRQ